MTNGATEPGMVRDAGVPKARPRALWLADLVEHFEQAAPARVATTAARCATSAVVGGPVTPLRRCSQKRSAASIVSTPVKAQRTSAATEIAQARPEGPQSPVQQSKAPASAGATSSADTTPARKAGKAVSSSCSVAFSRSGSATSTPSEADSSSSPEDAEHGGSASSPEAPGRGAAQRPPAAGGDDAELATAVAAASTPTRPASQVAPESAELDEVDISMTFSTPRPLSLRRTPRGGTSRPRAPWWAEGRNRDAARVALFA